MSQSTGGRSKAAERQRRYRERMKAKAQVGADAQARIDALARELVEARAHMAELEASIERKNQAIERLFARLDAAKEQRDVMQRRAARVAPRSGAVH